ncbi:PREDICTED: pentatricopeptide repeat-containing protein At5g52850, chloroplastic [Nelumbo nucifera]|uniref:Pentatricopeptide repeat-containing protein At5g52850, chloroplastic n=2 Tax=Nelumbo nucifera TaxID=4432 RepID=A0A1U8AFI3_NELNU|nr:PREDICTED: pentatricopeptide repeat-containing protein At5g52850, chloroplastic [Nelumbo nucifera]DAD44032.1 TPA_asm: hypothetical protein HUJ06_002262 [Nelumbo nucifera]
MGVLTNWCFSYSVGFGKFVTPCFYASPLFFPSLGTNSQIQQVISFSLRRSIFYALLHYTHFDQIRPVYSTLQRDHPIQSPKSIKFYLSKEVCSWVLSFSNSRSLKEGMCVHSPIIKLGLQDDLLLNNNLLSLYGKCFGVEQAWKMFDGMSDKDVVSWTGMISAYVRSGKHEEALELFNWMIVSGLVPNEFTFSSVLRSCSSLGEFELGTCIQARIIKHGFESNPVLGSTLINLYSKCNKFLEVSDIFASMENGDTVSWTATISSFVRARDWTQSLRLYSRMIRMGVPPNEFTFVELLAASVFLGLDHGKLVHAHVILWGIKLNKILKTALVDMYSKCQRMGDAEKVSVQTPEADVLLWTALISGYTRVLDVAGAIAIFRKMITRGFMPNNFTYAGVLNACSSILDLRLGQQIHLKVIQAGLEHDVSVGNALVDMYMKCSSLMGFALKAFEEILSPNIISWTSLIAGFTQHGFEGQAFQAFFEMRIVGEEPNSFTLSSILKACHKVGSLNQVQSLHAYILKTKLDTDTTVANALIDVYARLQVLDYAWRVFNMMNHRDAITYTSLATMINHMGNHEMTVNILTNMHNNGVKMDDFSLASFLCAYASLAAIEPGKQLHCYAVKSSLCRWISVSNGLVDFYGKCGSMHDACRIFMEITEPNIVSWNGLISGLALNGHFFSALSRFEDMKLAGIEPDNITFLLVLYACSHGGLVDQGLEYFHSMSKSYNMIPQLDHYVCLVDLLGRAGRLEEAVNVIETMPFTADALIYKTMLASCRLHGNIALGEDMARRVLELDQSDPAIYVLLANMYDDAGRSDLGNQTRQLMRQRGLRKNPGQSWIEIRNKVHVFKAGDRSHPQINEIHEKLESLGARLDSLGYSYEDNASSSYHSEKLAVGFGLLGTTSRAPIRIIKNLRICKDCHTFIRLVTEVVDREIIMRDGNRYHMFKKGDCSCRGYW